MKDKNVEDLEASIAVISTNVDAFYKGNLHTFRPVAVEIRKLLCDTRGKKDNSLLKRIFPRIQLHLSSGNSKVSDPVI